MFSVDTEQEAQDLLVLACSTNKRGEFVAQELLLEQTLPNLQKFSDRLAKFHEILMKHRQGDAA